MSEKNDTPMLELNCVSKHYGNVVALDNVGLSIYGGRVTCVLGDNGAGKSTLIKILAGRYSPDKGEFKVQGDEVQFSSPRDSLDRGISTVYQDLTVAPLMPIWRNFFLGSELTAGRGVFKRLDVKRMRRVCKQEMGEMGIDLRDTDQPIGTLSGGERQCVAISRAIYFGARLLILDEPTAALGVKQSGIVLRYVMESRRRGLGVVLITHNPNHAYPVGDEFLLLKRGRSIGYYDKEDLQLDELTAMMAGGEELEGLLDQLRDVGADPTAIEEVEESQKEAGISGQTGDP